METKTYLVFFNLDEPNRLYPNVVEALQSRITKVGAHYRIAKNVYILKTTLLSFEIYSGLSRGLEGVEILVSEINDSDNNIFGSMPKEFWNFLHIETKQQ